MKRRASLQARLLALVLGLGALVWSAAAMLTWQDAQHELDELLDGHLAQAAALLVVQQAVGEAHDELPDAPALHKYAPRVAFQVFHQGRLMMRSANADVAPMASFTPGFSTVHMPDGTPWRVFATAGVDQDVQVLVGESLDARGAILRAILRSVLWPLIIALPLLGGAGWWSVRRGLAPLRRLSAQLKRRRPEALAPMASGGLPVEMRPLVEALNELLARIAQMIENERRFTADAAHELRTPIAAIRTQAQVALGAGEDAAQRRHALQATLAGCDRAAHLVEQLLQLARLESAAAQAAPPAELGPELVALARQVAAELAPQALAWQQTLAFDAPANETVGCVPAPHEALWRMLLRNLLDNASRYSPPGAQVRLSVRQEAQEVVLTVEDSGPGMTPEQIARLGERFFRVLGSERPGSGLGWSIVRRIAQVLALRVEVGRSATLGGLRVTVRGALEGAAAPAACRTIGA